MLFVSKGIFRSSLNDAHLPDVLLNLKKMSVYLLCKPVAMVTAVSLATDSGLNG